MDPKVKWSILNQLKNFGRSWSSSIKIFPVIDSRNYTFFTGKLSSLEMPEAGDLSNPQPLIVKRTWFDDIARFVDTKNGDVIIPSLQVLVG